MVVYDLAHLTQDASQRAAGPVQDDEALLLFAWLRCVRARRVLEIGGLGGYSATNFLKAVGDGGTVYTVDIDPVARISGAHVVIQKDAKDVRAADVGSLPLDLVFFDCHAFEAQVALFQNLYKDGVITNATTIALHDTGVHFAQFFEFAHKLKDGTWVHQPVERRLVNWLCETHGYHAVHAHTHDASRHSEDFPYRHGLTLCQKARRLDVV